MVMMMGKSQDRSVGRNQSFCFGAPRLVGIDEHHNLEVQSRDLRRPLGVDNPAGTLPLAGLRFLADTSCPPSFLVTLCLLTQVAPEFSHNSGSKWFYHERIVMKQQSRSLAELSRGN